MRKLTFAAGVTLGYVLGSRAGRPRYEQIVATSRRVADRPDVRFVAGVVSARVSNLFGGGTAA